MIFDGFGKSYIFETSEMLFDIQESFKIYQRKKTKVLHAFIFDTACNFSFKANYNTGRNIVTYF